MDRGEFYEKLVQPSLAKMDYEEILSIEDSDLNDLKLFIKERLAKIK
jgi:hypothetical protein